MRYPFPRFTVALIGAAGGLWLGTAAAATSTGLLATWSGGDGVWTAGPWLGLPPGVYPNDSAIAVLIDGAGRADSMVTATGTTGSNIDVASLTVDAGDGILFPNTRSITVATGGFLHNDGELRCESGGGINFSGVRLNGDQTITGSGTFAMIDWMNHAGSGNALRSDGHVITNSATHTIRGAGALLDDTGGMINYGTIISDQPNGALRIRPDANGFIQQPEAVLLADSPDGILLHHGVFTNLGSFDVADGSKLVLGRDALVIGGRLATAGSGEIHAAGYGPPNPNIPPILDGVELATGSTVRQTPSQAIRLLGGTTNRGTWIVEGANALRAIDSLTIDGDGDIVLDNTGAILRGEADGIVITNGPDHTVRGVGRIMDAVGGFVNDGAIIADAGRITIRPGADGFVHAAGATLRAEHPDGILLFDGDFTNLGVFTVADGSELVLGRDSHIIGGDFETDGTGAVRAAGYGPPNPNVPPILENVRLRPDSTFRQTSSQNARLLGGLTNDGAWRIEGAAELRAIESLTISGTGAVILANTGAEIRPENDGDVLVNGADHTIRGEGRVLDLVGGLVNEGAIVADVNDGSSRVLTVRPGDAGVTNVGEMRAESGGTLRLLGGVITNPGAIRVDDASFVNLDGVTIVGGTIENVPGGTGQFSIANHPTLVDVTIGAGSVVPAVDQEFQDATIVGSLTNNNAWLVRSSADLICAGDVTLATDSIGAIALTHVFARLVSDGGTITNGPGHLVSGIGRVLANSGGFENHGRVVATGTNLIIDPADDRTFANHGSLEVADDATMTVNAGGFTTDGETIIGPGGLLNRTGVFTQTDGQTTVHGELQASAGVDLQGGTLDGSGLVDATVTNTGGTIAPGMSIGTLTVEGDLTLDAGGTLLVELASGGSDLLVVDGDATVGGTLFVDRLDHFIPAFGETFTVLTADAVSGTFDLVEGSGLYEAVYGDDFVAVTFLGLECPDVTGDGVVDALDLAGVLASWGACPPEGGCPYDFNGSGAVDAEDLAILLGNWGPCPE